MFATLQTFAHRCVAQCIEPLATSRSLIINHGISGLRLETASMRETYRAAFAGTAPSIKEDGQQLIMHARCVHGMLRDVLYGHRDGWSELTLNNTTPWMIHVRGGMRGLEANLLDVWCPSLHISGGLYDGNIVLGHPQQTSMVHIHGGVNQLRLVRPHGVQIHLHIRGGSSSVVFDGLQVPEHGSSLTLGQGHAQHRYDVVIDGGASNVLIDTFED